MPKVALRPAPRTVLLIAFLSALGAWEAASRTRLVHAAFVAAPSEMITAFWQIAAGTARTPVLYPHLSLTLLEIVVSFAIVAALGLFAGFVIGEIRVLRDTLEPVIVALFAVPNVILFPIIFLFVGLGPLSRIVFGIILGFFPIVSNTIAGLRQVDRPLIVAAQSMGASRLQLYGKVVLPGAAPSIISGLKQGLSLAIIGVLVAELIASAEGVGYLLNYARSLLFTPELFALIALGLAISMIGIHLFSLVEGRIHR